MGGRGEHRGTRSHTEPAVDYYWRESSQNKALYKRSRFYIIALGALLTLIASLASASFVSDEAWLDRSFAIATPVLAALLAMCALGK